MSKAVLVVDMPESCGVCELVDDGLMRLENGKETQILYCGVPTCGEDVTDYVGCRPEFCPLREVPQKADIKKAATMTSLTWCEGYNACIDKIEGGVR